MAERKCRYAGHNVCDGTATHEIRWPDGIVYYVCDTSANAARLRCHTAKVLPLEPDPADLQGMTSL